MGRDSGDELHKGVSASAGVKYPPGTQLARLQPRSRVGFLAVSPQGFHLHRRHVGSQPCCAGRRWRGGASGVHSESGTECLPQPPPEVNDAVPQSSERAGRTPRVGRETKKGRK
ncbi:hypothetical protein C8Q80DRAFT_153143 [Daedaleopsis nitida]|nr:hypothetical protein C8Q80DRAFT_153143 [Daedaleopsis nitida]